MSNKKMFWGVPLGVIESGNIRELMEYGSRSKWGIMASLNKFKIYRKASQKIKAYHGSYDGERESQLL